MTPIQILILLFALFAISRAAKQFRTGALTIAWLIFWVCFWIAVGAVTFAPQTTDALARFAGVGRGADMVVYLSLVGLFFLVFRLFIKIEDVEQEITQLVRKDAIEKVEKSTRL